MAPTGVLLIQLGTPRSPSTGDVRRYLREFLSDPRVLDMPAPLRVALLNTIILPLRPRRSAEAYRQIWTEAGSPLELHTAALADAVDTRLGDRFRVKHAMRYQEPSVSTVAGELIDSGCDRLIVFPLFPQYASASTGSAVEHALEVIGSLWNTPDVTTIGAFYDHPGFIGPVAAIARPLLDSFQPDHVLFSYHGLPEKHIEKSDPTGSWCLAAPTCCDTIVAENRWCYRAQSHATTRGLVDELALESDHFSTTFQSRLRGQKWIEPYTDIELPRLYARGVRRLAIITPSFTADCLETLEEIGIRAREQWMALGGEDFLLVPCVNADDRWADAVAAMVEEVS